MTSDEDTRPILDLRFHKDPLSRNFAARSFVGSTPRFKRVWTTRKEGPLNQGREGACVGFSCAGELAAKPAAYPTDDRLALKIYAAAREVDRSEGRNFSSGATVLAGMKACQRARYFQKYVWCFGIDDAINWVVRKGPTIWGINWYESMYEPNRQGLLSVEGDIAGGHAIMCNGFWPNHPQFGDVLVFTNSWGKSWGLNGRAYLSVADGARLLKEDGEVAAPTDFPIIAK